MRTAKRARGREADAGGLHVERSAHGTLGPRVPHDRGARQATPRRCLTGTEPFGSTPWRRCDVWIHDPIRRLMGASEHPRYSPYALLVTTGFVSMRVPFASIGLRSALGPESTTQASIDSEKASWGDLQCSLALPV